MLVFHELCTIQCSSKHYIVYLRPLHLLGPLLHLPELGDILLEAGASVNARNNALNTPLAIACRANNPFLARILVENGKVESIHNQIM